MENDFITRRRLIIILVTVTVVVFIGLVVLITSLQPWNLLGVQVTTPTPDAPVIKNCTYPIAYWKAHPELYPAQVIIGGTVYQERELEALLADDSQDMRQQIRAQLGVAFLNSLTGADQNSIKATIFDAYAWLVKHPSGSLVTAQEQEEGKRLLSALEAYNTGLGKVSPCDALSALPKTVTPSITTTIQAGIATHQTGTPSATLTITRTTTRVSPTATPTPTTTRLVAPSDTPTQKAPVGPTITPTTPSPTPTRTTPPTFTDTPQPTFTATLPPTLTYTPTLPPPPTDIPEPTLPSLSLP